MLCSNVWHFFSTTLLKFSRIWANDETKCTTAPAANWESLVVWCKFKCMNKNVNQSEQVAERNSDSTVIRHSLTSFCSVEIHHSAEGGQSKSGWRQRLVINVQQKSIYVLHLLLLSIAVQIKVWNFLVGKISIQFRLFNTSIWIANDSAQLERTLYSVYHDQTKTSNQKIAYEIRSNPISHIFLIGAEFSKKSIPNMNFPFWETRIWSSHLTAVTHWIQ